MTHRRRIAVLGAGYVGGAFARAAAMDDATDVWAVRRSEGRHDTGLVTWLTGDITEAARADATVNGLPSSLDVVVLTIAPSRGAVEYRDTYPPGAAAAVRLAQERGAHSMLYTSSTGVYGGRDGAWVSEASPRLGLGDANAALIAAEDIVAAAHVPRVTVLRVAGIYGPGRDPRERMGNAGSLPQCGACWTNLAHRDDIVGAMLHVLALHDAPPILNVSDGAPRRAADIARWLAAAGGRDPASLVFSNHAQPCRNDQRVSNASLCGTGWTPRFATFAEGFASGM